MTKKIAVVLFNLGGPDGPAAVRPFLFNLFNDPAIIRAPTPIRLALAWFIAKVREKSAQANYAKMGGGSPILPQTEAQAEALKAYLKAQRPQDEFQTFIAMRYWKPFTETAVAAVKGFQPTTTILAPLYPQFSTTTTDSSVKAWHAAYGAVSPAKVICCYPDAPGLAAAHFRSIAAAAEKLPAHQKFRILFSAHGLPETIVAAGDPYPEQVAVTVKATVDLAMAAGWKAGSWDHQICYQSRVGPLKWIGPSLQEALAQARADDVAVLVCPISFVSEHVETLVELDDEYAHIASGLGLKAYVRAQTPQTDPDFIAALGDAVLEAVDNPLKITGCYRSSGCQEGRRCLKVESNG